MQARTEQTLTGRLLPVAALVAPLLPDALAALWVLAVGVLWLRTDPPRRQRWLVGALLLLACLTLTVALVQRRSLGPEDIDGRLSAGFEEIWQNLEGIAEETNVAAAGPLADVTNRRVAFAELQRLTLDRGRRETLELLNPDGVAVAWAGEGLIHDVDELGVPAEGRSFRAGFNAVTLLVVRPLMLDVSGWRVLAGRSYPTDELPWSDSRLEVNRWSAVEAGAATDTGSLRVVLAEGPVFLVDGGLRVLPALGRSAPGRVAWAFLAMAALAAAVLSWIRGSDGGPQTVSVAGLILLLSGLAAALAALRMDLLVASLLTASTGACGAVRLFPSLRIRSTWIAGLAAVVAAPAIGLWLQTARHPIDLGSLLLGSAEEMGLRVAALLTTLAILGLAYGKEDTTGRERRAWLALLALVLGGLFLDSPAFGLPLLLTGAVLAAGWARRSALPRRIAPLTVFLVLGSLVAALGWELSYRVSLKRHLRIHTLNDVAPPGDEELAAQSRVIQKYFRTMNLASLSLGDPNQLEDQDLAYAVWSESPLAMRGALSALTVETPFGKRSSFSFGLPMDEDGDVDRSPARWRQIGTEFRPARFVEGEAELLLDGQPWGVARYWLFRQPGARGGRIENLIAGLLRGEPIRLRPDDDVLGAVQLVLYSADGQALSSPWDETPSAATVLGAGPGAQVETPLGRSLVFAVDTPESRRALFLPLLTPWLSLERVTTHALGSLAVLGLALLASFLVAARSESLRRALRQAFRSYSQRLLIVSTAFVMLPLLAVSILLVGFLGRRLEREQQEDGRSALESAQRILGEYVLALETGFGIETTLDDEILSWLSRVVHHEVNLYFGSSVSATSKRALFTAGLLPKRIPGEIFSRLTLGDSVVASRINRAGGTRYLELYAPVRIPGVPLDAVGLYASMPLLAQEEEVEEELAALRRRAVLMTVGLSLLLAAIGSRIARRFTTPLMEVVEGTQRIAAGARSLGLAPTELELATLAEAIDRMAVKIDEGRQRLVREKDLLDRMIDNITSGVISLDREGCVVMANRAALGLFGVEVGQRLEPVLAAGGKRYASVLAFVEEAHPETAVRTVRMGSGEEEVEWSLVWVPLPGPGEPTALLVVEDVTEVLRAQRLEAWAEMARIIAHEIKNPLTPIRLSAEHMRQVRDSDPAHFEAVFERCTSNILEQVDELQQISSEFSAYSRLPKIDRQAGDLLQVVRKVVEAYASSPRDGVSVELRADLEELPGRFDGKLVGRALRNLVENALRAAGAGGSVTVGVERQGHEAQILVLDDGPGVNDHELSRMFEPYFSTHDSGTGLGLPIARRIAEEHGGRIEARNRPQGGLEVSFVLPLG